MSTIRKFIDISANLTDPMFFGIYNGSKKHKCDMVAVLERAFSNGLKKIILPGGSLRESTDCIELSRCDGSLFCTVGCHPTRCNEFEQSGSSTKYLEDLLKLAKENVDKVVAIGECGLDYDRLHFCSKEVQIRFFELQLQLSKELQLPLLLHCRNAASDLIEILKRNADGLCGGVVHSFDGSEEDAKTFLELGYYIGINGCSLKTKQNLDVMATIPSNRLMIETDCPWCEVRPSHAGFKYIKTTFSAVKKEKWIEGSMVKGRCEPSHVTCTRDMAGIEQPGDEGVRSAEGAGRGGVHNRPSAWNPNPSGIYSDGVASVRPVKFVRAGNFTTVRKQGGPSRQRRDLQRAVRHRSGMQQQQLQLDEEMKELRLEETLETAELAKEQQKEMKARSNRVGESRDGTTPTSWDQATYVIIQYFLNLPHPFPISTNLRSWRNHTSSSPPLTWSFVRSIRKDGTSCGLGPR